MACGHGQGWNFEHHILSWDLEWHIICTIWASLKEISFIVRNGRKEFSKSAWSGLLFFLIHISVKFFVHSEKVFQVFNYYLLYYFSYIFSIKFIIYFWITKVFPATVPCPVILKFLYIFLIKLSTINSEWFTYEVFKSCWWHLIMIASKCVSINICVINGIPSMHEADIWYC